MKGNVSNEHLKHERPYDLNIDVLVSLDAIQKKLIYGYKSIMQVHEHESYLQSLHAKLVSILNEERNHGIVNESLPSHIISVFRMLERVKLAKTNF
jgi:hypothetical protein